MEISREQMAGSGMPSDEEARAPWSTVACRGGGINQQSPAGLSWLFHIQGGLLVPGAKGSTVTLQSELEEMVAENPS